jgi:D-beta-D-heptose 7-phosphate kinase/D-beta-D-heptose 1-phosphate adenosyltransferase
MDALLSHLADWRTVNVLVVGDFMLDEHVYGNAERLSGDAPVPILHARRVERVPGGAANVALDLIALRCDVRVAGVVGDDPDGRFLRETLEAAGAGVEALVADPARPTTVKQNLVGLAQHRHPQKMFRLDRESREPLAPAVLDEILRRVEDALPWADVVALEDYAKGVCDERLCQGVIRAAARHGVPVIVDPAAAADFDQYRGCAAITPNRTEAERATRLADRAETPPTTELIAHDLSARLDCEAVVLTLDREGALLLERGAEAIRLPTVARQVYDVTGAGDMVLAALCAARGNGLAWPDAVRLANLAAGLEVEVFGVQPIPLERIHQHALALARGAGEKRRSLREAVIEVAAARAQGRTVVFTNGCFDLLHAGHVSLIREAKRLGDLLIVAANSDDSIRRLKGPDRPVHAEADRVALLSELASVDLVVVFEDDTPERVLEALRPDVLVKGADYAVSEVVGRDIVERHGGRVELVGLLEGRSSTAAIERIRSG